MKNILTLCLLLFSVVLYASPKDDLFEAIFSGDIIAVKQIVKSKKQANLKSNDGVPVLYFASSTKKNEIALYLVDNGADVLWKNKKQSILHAACEGGMSWLVNTILLQSTASVNSLNYFNKTPLMLASSSGCDTAVNLLLQYGATDLDNALDRALYNEFFTTAQILVDSGASINSLGNNNPAINYALDLRSIGVAKFLVDNGADINAPISSGSGNEESILYIALRRQMVEFCSFCILNGADFGHPIEIRESIYATNARPVLGCVIRNASLTYSHPAITWLATANNILDIAVQDGNLDSVFNDAKYILDIAIRNEFELFLYNVLYYDEARVLDVITDAGDTISAMDYIAQSDMSYLLGGMEGEVTPIEELYEAITNQDLGKAKSLIKKGVDHNGARQSMMIAGTELERARPVECAINTGNLKIAKYFLSIDGYWRIEQSFYKIAAKNNDVAMFEFLISKDEDFEENKNWILYSILREAPVFIETMLKHGADADNYIFNGQSFLFYAVRIGNVESVNHFINYSKKIEPEYKRFYRAIEQSDAKSIKSLIADSVDINKNVVGGLTPLCWAVYLGNYSMTKLLIENNADVNIKMSDQYEDYPIYGSSPTRWAVSKKHANILKLLIDSGATPNAFLFLNESVTIVHLAVQMGNVEVVRLLLNTDIELNDVSVWNMGLVGSPFDLAGYYGETEMCQLFLEAGFDVDNKAVGKFTPLLNAVSQKHFETAQFLIAHGADVNYPLPFESILAESIRLSSPEIIAFLFDKGMVLTDTSEMLRYAIEYQDTNVINVILDKGAAIEVTVPNTEPLIHAVSKRNMNKFGNYEFLVRHGVDINAANRYGKTILHEAVENNDLDLIAFLINNGANLNVSNVSHDRENPLDMVQSMAAFKLLKSNGAKHFSEF